MNWTIKTFDELTSKEIYEILRSRAEVFVKEQKISYVDPDGVDYKSWQMKREFLSPCVTTNILVVPVVRFWNKVSYSL